MTAPLTPMERVEAAEKLMSEYYTFGTYVVSAGLAYELAAELEEANRRREAAERQLAEKDARIAELESSLSQPKAKWETVGEGVVLPDFDAL